jgi:hypothetical protein
MMPSTSKKQHNLMEAVAHNAAFAKKVGISQKVGKDFVEADKGKKFSRGGESQATIQGINKPKTNHGTEALFKRGGTMATKKMTKGGMSETMGPRSMSSDVEKGSNRNTKHGEHAIQKRGKTKAMMPKMAGSDTGMKRGGKVKK